jgi:hypothetical protein
VVDVLLGVIHKLGIRAHNIPDEFAFAVLVHHVGANYGNHTAKEIALAFDMAMVGQLDGDLKCYENFSCEYFSTVMRAYRQWAKEQYRQLPAPPPVVPKTTEQMSDFAMLRWLAQEIRFIKTGKPFEFIPVELYDYLDKRGKITATNAEKRAYFSRAIAWRAGELAKDVEKKNNVDTRNAQQQFIQQRDKGSFAEAEYERLTKIAKKLLFFDLVQNLD